MFLSYYKRKNLSIAKCNIMNDQLQCVYENIPLRKGFQRTTIYLNKC